jgi:hypothetical protein
MLSFNMANLECIYFAKVQKLGRIHSKTNVEDAIKIFFNNFRRKRCESHLNFLRKYLPKYVPLELATTCMYTNTSNVEYFLSIPGCVLQRDIVSAWDRMGHAIIVFMYNMYT